MINIKSDSRKVKKGDIFVALDGINSNGSCYIQNAIENGASKIVCKQGSFDVETINVKDPKAYLTNYLNEHYNKYLDEMTLIGITGTNGKTTTAYLIYQLLNNLGCKCAYIGTIGFYLDKKVCNLPNTSPDACTLYDMFMKAYKNGFKYIVLEVSSQGLSYHRFDGIKFDYGIFTNLTEDHLDYHKTMDNYAAAKKILFNQLKDNGKSIINADSKYLDYYKTSNFVTYGIYNGDYKVSKYKMTSSDTSVTIKHQNLEHVYNYSLIGKYNIYNVMAAITLVNQIGINLDRIPVSKLKSPAGRMDIIKYKDNSIIIDYAHTPDAMENIYQTVRPIVRGKIITVFGCTGDREKEKRPIMMDLALKNSSYVIVTSDDLHDEDFNNIVCDMTKGIQSDKYKVERNRGRAIEMAINTLNSLDALLILGKGHEEFIIEGPNKIPFNDHKKVIELIDKIKVG